MSRTIATTTRLVLALGLRNVAYAAAYRFGLRAGIHPVQRIPEPDSPRGPFFDACFHSTDLRPPTLRASSLRYFGWFDAPHRGKPDWFQNPFTARRVRSVGVPWWQIADFDPMVGDIKTIWEASRLDWVVRFAQCASAGDSSAIEQLNTWLDDWCAANPPYRGPNWKCGQEASIRVLHLALAAMLLRQVDTPSPSLTALVATHLRRIEPTIHYAIAQDNNHGTSEGAALFIGGSWMERIGNPAGLKWREMGRRCLEERAHRLIEADGTFSQYSVNYHRLMLDTFSLAEVWRGRVGLRPFSGLLQRSVSAATSWLRAFVDPYTGDAPNIGHNDGAQLLPLTDAKYRDFRPAVHLAAALFQNMDAYPDHDLSVLHLRWLGVTPGRQPAPKLESVDFDKGGFAVLRAGEASAVFRYPRFRFRPSHADALHVDLNVGGENLLRDGGSFSYADIIRGQHYFPGTEAHNTVQFDARDQMTRLGPFLWGDWLTTTRTAQLQTTAGSISIGAQYRDRTGATHERHLALHATRLVVTDHVDGFCARAVLRWRLLPGEWRLNDAQVTNGSRALRISANVPVVRLELTRGWESRHYHQITGIPVLEVEIARGGTLISEFCWSR